MCCLSRVCLFVHLVRFRFVAYSRTASSNRPDCIAVSVFRRVRWIAKSDNQLRLVRPPVRMVTVLLTLDRYFLITCGFVEYLSRKLKLHSNPARTTAHLHEDILLW